MYKIPHVFLLVVMLLSLNLSAQNNPQFVPPDAKGALAQKAAMQWEFMDKWSKMDDMTGSGPFPATYEMAPGGLEYVVYFPKDIEKAAQAKKLGVYIWGNGGCGPDGATARFHLTEIASRGFIAIAPGKILSGPHAPKTENDSTEQSQEAISFRATDEKMIAALDWILAENEREGSQFYHVIDPNRLAVGGNSCGGLIALKASLDPRFKALSVQNSGTFTSAPAGMNLPGLTKADLPKLHLPVLYIEGGPEDIAQPNALDDFENINHVPVFIADHPGAGHIGLFYEPNGEGTKVEIDWILWQLDGDKVAAQTFVGENCELCHDFRWVVYRKGELFHAE